MMFEGLDESLDNVAPEIFQSKGGWYYPCSQDTFLQLLELRTFMYAALQTHHAWLRWAKRKPRNRHKTIYIRDTEGRKIGKQSLGELQEPICCPLFSHRNYDWSKSDRQMYRVWDGHNIEKDFQNARRPVPSAIEVVPLINTTADIDRKYWVASEWYWELFSETSA